MRLHTISTFSGAFSILAKTGNDLGKIPPFFPKPFPESECLGKITGKTKSKSLQNNTVPIGESTKGAVCNKLSKKVNLHTA